MFSVTLGNTLLQGNDSSAGAPATTRDAYQVSSPSIAIDSQEGYRSASFTITTDRWTAEYLLGQLGGDVAVYDHNHYPVWEGLVDRIQATIGPMTVGAGPLSEISNKVKIRYTEYDWGVAPVTPEEVETDWIYNQDSIARWGTLEQIVSRGREMSPGEASRSLDELAYRLSKPKLFRDISTSTNELDRIDVQFECVGYTMLLKKKYYGIYEEGMWGVGDAIRDIISYHSLLNASGVIDVAQQVGKYTGEYTDPPELGYDVIMEYISTLASDSGYGFCFGVYQNRTVHFTEIVKPPSPDYRISPHTGKLTDMWGSPIYHVPQPGQWVTVPMVSLPQYNNDLVDAAFPIAGIEFTDSGDLRINEVVKASLSSLSGI